MDAESIVYLLEQNWQKLPAELGTHWDQFAKRFHEIVARLPANPERSLLEKTVDALCDLLNETEYGRGLLHGFQMQGRERLIASAANTLSDQEKTKQVCNRLRKLQETKTSEKAV